MSGLNEQGGLYGAVESGLKASPRDLDLNVQYIIQSPSVSASFIAAGTGSTNTAFVIASAIPDYPRNFLYQVTGGTTGGTFTLNGYDQFGAPITESVVVGTASAGGSASGTAIWGSVASGTYYPLAANNGTATVGFGTKTGGPATAGANWFGLPVKIGGTTDVKMITWINNTTPTAINKGTAFGTLVGGPAQSGGTIPAHAFQGTSGVAATDKYVVTIKSTFDNAGKTPIAGF